MKSKTFRVSLVILLLAVITMSLTSGTLAKYVETVYGTDSARVAKFEYTATAGGTTLTTSPVAIDLFNTEDDTEVYDPEGHNLNSQKLVAPGTFGHFDVVTTNLSEVEVGVSYTIEETNAGNVPIVYFVKDSNNNVRYYSDKVSSSTVALGPDIATYITTLTGSTVESSATVSITGNLEAMSTSLGTTMDATNNSTGITKTDVVGWFWAFGDATNNVDTADTTLGLAGTATVQVNLGVTFTQVD
ncbi:MAG: hypothetical protein IKM97_00940 [Clostridia bacterium]|nr:hypothetical protein [Clostridia bacterium]